MLHNMKTILFLCLTGTLALAAPKNPLGKLELQQAKKRAEMLDMHHAELQQLLARQIAAVTALRQKYLKAGDAQSAAAAAKALAELRRNTDFQPVKVKEKLFVETIVDAKPAAVKMMLPKPARLVETESSEKGPWARVPNALLGASIYATPRTGANATADFTVTKSGTDFSLRTVLR